MPFPTNPTDNEVWTNPETHKIYQYRLSENKWLEVTNLVNLGHSHDGIDSRKVVIGDLDGVTLVNPENTDLLQFNGSQWIDVSNLSILKPFFNYAFSKSGYVKLGWLNAASIPSNVNSYLIPYNCIIYNVTLSMFWDTEVLADRHTYEFTMFVNGSSLASVSTNRDRIFNTNISLNAGDKVSFYIDETSAGNLERGENPIVEIFGRGL